MGMINVIRDYLITEGYNAVKFGDGIERQPPYYTVKGERLPEGRGVRIIGHRVQGEGTELENDMRAIGAKLANRGFTTTNGNYNRLGEVIDWQDVSAVSDDNTISFEVLLKAPNTSF
jgi:hypothetical protein